MKSLLCSLFFACLANASTYYTIVDTNTHTLFQFETPNPVVVPTLVFPPPNDDMSAKASAFYQPASGMQNCGGNVYTCVLAGDGVYLWNWNNPSLGLSVQVEYEEKYNGQYEQGGFVATFGTVDLSVPGEYDSATQHSYAMTINNSGYVLPVGYVPPGGVAPEPASIGFMGLGLIGLACIRRYWKHAK